MMTPPDPHQRQRQELADALRKGTMDADPDHLIVDYACLYDSLHRIPLLQEIDAVLREEGTHDVVAATDILDTIVSMHPAHAVIVRLHACHSNQLPTDDAIAAAIRDECARLRTPPTKLTARLDGTDYTGLASQLDEFSDVWRLERLTVLEVMLPQRVREIWLLCQTLGFSPFSQPPVHRPS
ncbi:MAG: hypothetical protein EON60_12130 [Alphaproteobacteria bacterium]|nr:MAG: hypothetical protein EON60_12130 [Alphaproteobacteria bacterium]